jgi:hypothetical protein
MVPYLLAVKAEMRKGGSGKTDYRHRSLDDVLAGGKRGLGTNAHLSAVVESYQETRIFISYDIIS